MSAQSLPHISGNSVFRSFLPKLCVSKDKRKNSGESDVALDNNSKYNSLPMRGRKGSRGLDRGPSKIDEVLQKRLQRLNRNGSIGNLQFRGIKKEFLETQTSLMAHTMTVGGGQGLTIEGSLIVKVILFSN